MASALAASVLLLAACKRHAAAAADVSPPAISVQSATVRAAEFRRTIPVGGTVRPRERATIAAKIPGTIESLPLALGQSVKRGDLLARIAAPELAARLAQARTQSNQAVRDEERIRQLAASGADNAEAARSAADRLSFARAAVSEAEAMLAYAEIRAPFDGRVAALPAYAGDLAAPGQTLLVLENPASLQIEIPVPATLAGALTRGTRLAAHVAGLSEPVECPVAEIAAAADSSSQSVLVRVALSPGDTALSGRYARVEIPDATAGELLIPASAVTRFGQMERVFVVEKDHARLRLVKTGASHGTDVEILAGLNAGERVIVSPAAALRDGHPVVAAP